MPPKRKVPSRPKRKKRPVPSPRAAAALPSAPYQLQEQEVERSLVTGENADLLQRYFGEQRYAELRALARNASARSVRGGPRVLILPGIMGSTLGSPGPLFFDDVIWIDPIDIAAGELTTLALLPGSPTEQSLGVIL